MASASEALKEAGNELVKQQQYAKAVEQYTAALAAATDDQKELKTVLFSNRALCNLKIENYGLSLADAREALALDPRFVKAYYRRGDAHFALGRYKEACVDFKKVLQLRPNDKDAKAKFKECDKEYRRVMFERAIESEHTQSAFESVDINAMRVDDAYTGPRLLDGSDAVSLEFVTHMMALFKDQKTIPVAYVWRILRGCKTLFEKQPTLVDVPLGGDLAQITVCGDTHGQFYDVLRLFEINGLPSPSNPYLFNGDFVDRGSFSTEVIITFLALKLLYPTAFFMARGNHETISMNRMYGFEGEVRHKYEAKLMGAFTEVFNLLPLAHCINGKVLVVHGGLFSKDGVTLDDIRKLPRNCQPSDTGLMSDLLWSDPAPMPGRSPSKRGVGLSFGPDITKAFLDANGLDLLVRSHEVKPEGYEIEHNGKCITIFSAPNYCDQIGNKAAYIIFKPDCKPDIRQFEAAPHPKVPIMAYGNSNPFAM